MSDSLAIIDGDNVIIVSNDIEYTIPKSDYDYVKECFRTGVAFEDINPVIRPSDIIGYLEESNPEAEKNVVETEVTIAKRNMMKQPIQTIAIGAAVALGLIGLAAFYLIITKDSGTAAAAATTATDTAALTIA